MDSLTSGSLLSPVFRSRDENSSEERRQIIKFELFVSPEGGKQNIVSFAKINRYQINVCAKMRLFRTIYLILSCIVVGWLHLQCD